MAFESFLNKPYDEYELLLQVAEEVKNNFAQQFAMFHFLRLSKVDDKTSMIDNIKLFGPGDNPWIHVYIENDMRGGLLFKYLKDSISIILNGEHKFAEVIVTSKSVTLVDRISHALLPEMRSSGMTMLNIIEAFGDINSSLEQYKRHLAG